MVIVSQMTDVSEAAPIPASPMRQRSPLPDVLALTSALSVALVLGLRPFAEPDLWWHLRVGEHIRATGQLAGPDPWAVFADRDYVATQWLPEIVAALAYDVAGLGGILFLRSSAIVILALLTHIMCRKVAGPLVSASVTVLTLLASTASFNPRPQLLSFLFFAITVAAWRRTTQDHRPRWWLAPMFWLWGCCHGLWVFGLVLSAVSLLAMVIDRRTLASPSVVRQLALLCFLCTAAVALTPLGPRLLLTPLEVAGNASWVADEWQRTPFAAPASKVAAGMVLAAAAALLIRRSPPPLWQYAHLVLACIFLVAMWRLVPLAVILIAPLLASSLSALPRVPGRRECRTDPVARAIAVAGVLLAAGVVSLGPVGAASSEYPSDLTEVDTVLDCQPAGEIVFNDFGLSGWLLWRHPQLAPVVDIRAEIYARDYLKRFYVADGVRPGWQTVVEESGARIALLQPEAPLARALLSESGWVAVATSPGGVLLRRPDVVIDQSAAKCRLGSAIQAR